MSAMDDARDWARKRRAQERGEILPTPEREPVFEDDGLGRGGMDPTGGDSVLDLSIESDLNTPSSSVMTTGRNEKAPGFREPGASSLFQALYGPFKGAQDLTGNKPRVSVSHDFRHHLYVVRAPCNHQGPTGGHKVSLTQLADLIGGSVQYELPHGPYGGRHVRARQLPLPYASTALQSPSAPLTIRAEEPRRYRKTGGALTGPLGV